MSDGEEGERLESGWLADTPVDDGLVRRFVTGFADWIEASALVAGHPLLRTEDVVAIDEHSPHALLNNGILLRPVTPERVGRILDDVVGFFAAGEGGEYSLFSPWPTDLPDFSVSGYPPLMLRVPGGDAPPVPEGLEVVEVTTPELLAEYERVLVDGFPLEALQPWQPHGTLHPSALHLPGVRMFVGLVDGRGVTGASSIVAHGTNHVEWVATVEEARGRGFGAAITWAATLTDPSVPAMLIASDVGRPVYERMGYVALDRWTFFMRNR